jgi:hypothetical protein
MKIEIKTIDPASIRYSTCGDWLWLPDGTLQIFVPEYGGRDDNAFLVALHEMVEAWACKKDGISEATVSEWDKAHPHAEEPGDLPDSPYLPQHQLATQIERLMCGELGIDWDDHQSWVERAAWEVDRSHEFISPPIAKSGPRFWAELHLFALRHKTDREDWLWFDEWRQALPFDNCPCKVHLDAFVKENPPDWKDLFAWSVALHNDVNDRIGKPTISVDDARAVWMSKAF